MAKSNLPLAQHFSNLRKNPKWGLKLVITILILLITSIISTISIDYRKMYRDMNLSSQQLDQMESFAKITGLIGGSLASIIGIGIAFLIFLIISKIMKSDANAKSIFSATLSYSIITSVIALVVALIQFLTGLSPMDYNITSLNVFDKENKFLEVFNLQTFIGAYIFGIMLFETNNLNKKGSLIWSIFYLIIFIGLSLIWAY
ncbi:YIP1 family protein, partial [Staphylococcus saprophyticus]|uniref:YIP1 family protein n=1 Tax=Staphylococcus saprophyticus TaxID=29385 RepID=UPI000D1F8AE7